MHVYLEKFPKNTINFLSIIQPKFLHLYQQIKKGKMVKNPFSAISRPFEMKSYAINPILLPMKLNLTIEAVSLMEKRIVNMGSERCWGHLVIIGTYRSIMIL